jgi:hypothetical protein
VEATGDPMKLPYAFCALLALLFLAACESPLPAPRTTPLIPEPTPSVTSTPIQTVLFLPPTATPVVAVSATATQPPLPTATAVATPTSLPPVFMTKRPTPSRPANFTDYPKAILDSLNANPRNWSALEQMLKSWGALQSRGNRSNYGWNGTDNIAAVDVDGDGQEDMLIAVTDPDNSFPQRGMLLLYLRQKNTYRLAQQVGDPRNGYPSNPTIFAANDLLKDGGTEIVFTLTDCGAHTCFTTLDVLRWDQQQLRSLMDSPRQMANAEISLNPSGHGTLDILMHGGTIGSVGAGPQRAVNELYRWNGKAFTLTAKSVDPSNFLYFKVVDANALMLNKKYAEAAALYQEAITNPKLEVYGIAGPEPERSNLNAFARFRLMVAYALLNDVALAQSARDDLLGQQPEHIYAQVSNIFWQSYMADHSVSAGCRAVTSFALSHPEVAAVLANFGYANLGIKAEEVCPFR